MFSLFLDMAQNEAICALFRQDRVVEESHYRISEARHPTTLAARLLEAHGVSLHEVSYLVCGVGPGSYIGMRSVVATIQGVAFALQKPIVSLSSLILFVPTSPGEYTVVAEGKMQQVCVQRVWYDQQWHYDVPQICQKTEILSFGSPDGFVVPRSQDSLLEKNSCLSQEAHTQVIASIAFQKYISSHIHDPSAVSCFYGCSL